MKKNIKIGIVIIILMLLSFLVYKVVSKAQYKEEVKQTLQTIPAFSFTTLSGGTFTNTNLKTNMPSLFIYFDSTCDICQHEASMIEENIERLKHVQILFVSSEPIQQIQLFAETYTLLKHDNIVFLQDQDHTFLIQFDSTSIPYLLMYNKNQELIKKHKGQLTIESILNSLE